MDDPNNTNNSPETTGVENRQAIFTPQPEPTEPSSAPVSPVIPIEPNSGQTHPFFAHHPTQTFNTDTGDIILNTGSPKPKQNKRPFIIGGVILGVVVVICVIVLIVAGGGSKSSNPAVLVKAKTIFDQYANYLLYDTASNVLSGDYDNSKTYELDIQLTSDDPNNQYWENSLTLLDEAIAYFDNIRIEDETENEIYSFMQDQKDVLVFLYAYHQSILPNQEILMRRYLASGIEAANDYINESFKALQNASSQVAQNYLRLKDNEYSNGFALLDEYRSNGCINNDNSINEACVGNLYIAPDAKLNDVSNDAIKFQYEAEQLVRNKTKELESDCWTISDKLQKIISGGEA